VAGVVAEVLLPQRFDGMGLVLETARAEGLLGELEGAATIPAGVAPRSIRARRRSKPERSLTSSRGLIAPMMTSRLTRRGYFKVKFRSTALPAFSES
jgi:hypothetical protein